MRSNAYQFFDQKLPKIEAFRKFWAQINFFRKEFFDGSFGNNFVKFLSHHALLEMAKNDKKRNFVYFRIFPIGIDLE